MAISSSSDIRNIVLLGHNGAGKTTLAESMLFKAGSTTRQGSIDDGSSIFDFSDLEQEKQHSIDPALASVEHAGKKINIIDSPGYPDFIGNAISVIPGADVCVLVISATAGIEVNTRRLKLEAENAGKPLAIVINKIDSENIDLGSLMDSLTDTFGNACKPINLSTGGGQGIVDCFKSAEGDTDIGNPASFHESLVENIIESDEGMTEAYLEGEEIAPEKLSAVFGQAMVEKTLTPVVFTNAREGVGVKEFMDIVTSYFPEPASVKCETIRAGEGQDAKEVPCDIDAGKPFIGHAFKITSDPFVGKLAWIKILQGTVTPETEYCLGLDKKSAKIGHLYSVKGNKTDEIPKAVAGDIFAMAKVEEIKSGHILHKDATPMCTQQLPLPTPMYSLAITPKKRGDEKKLSEAMRKLAEEDRTFQPSRDAQTNETIISGMGETHLKMALAKMSKNFNIEVDTRIPKIPYKETITTKANGHYRHKKQTGGAGQFGEVYLRVEPLERDSGFVYESELFGESIPRQFLPAIEKGVVEAMHQGAVAGYPLQDIKVAITDGKHHPVDSKEVAFKTAGKNAFLDAVGKAGPVILEPVVNMEITIPADKMGDIASDLSGRRGQIQGQSMLPGNMASVKAAAPLASVRQYNSQLKSLTGGRGSFTMEFSHYAVVPGNVQQEIIETSRKQHEKQDE